MCKFVYTNWGGGQTPLFPSKPTKTNTYLPNITFEIIIGKALTNWGASPSPGPPFWWGCAPTHPLYLENLSYKLPITQPVTPEENKRTTTLVVNNSEDIKTEVPVIKFQENFISNKICICTKNEHHIKKHFKTRQKQLVSLLNPAEPLNSILTSNCLAAVGAECMFLSETVKNNNNNNTSKCANITGKGGMCHKQSPHDPPTSMNCKSADILFANNC